ncbi:MAG: zf-HC2 domain-containing protein [Alphaproteobacteria bacterium]|nr:zf-HC2 domain-containing protein [Alphaproteobacteria bacterium]
MTCEEIVSLLVDFFAGELDPETAALLEQHCQLCVDCEGFVNTYSATMQLAEQAFRRELTDDARSDIQARLRAALAGEA